MDVLRDMLVRSYIKGEGRKAVFFLKLLSGTSILVFYDGLISDIN